MKLPAKGQWLLLGLALLAASGSMVRPDGDAKRQEPAVSEAKPRKTEQAPANKAEPSLAGLEKIGNRSAPEKGGVDIFKEKSWYVPPPPPKPAPPPAPTAPPIPYAFMGSYRGDDGRLTVFLTRGDRVYSVSPGDVLEGTYRVEEIASGQLVLIYLPLNTRQTMSIGEAS